jgi:hypothetical protein
MNKNLEATIKAGRVRHGDKYDPSTMLACDESVLRHYGTRQRVKVTATYDDGETWTRTGTVSSTTGWRPALLLMHQSNAHGSWDVLGPRDRVVAVWDGNKYREVSRAS